MFLHSLCCSCTALAVAFVLGVPPALAVVVPVRLGVVAASLVFVTLVAVALVAFGLLQTVSKHGPRRSTCVQVFCGVQKWRDPRGVITKRNWILTESALSLLSVVVRSITSKPVTLGSRSRDF